MLQESEEKESEEVNADADVSADASKINEDYENMIISMEEEQKKIGLLRNYESICRKYCPKKPYGDQYVKLLILHFLKKQIFSTSF